MGQLTFVARRSSLVARHFSPQVSPHNGICLGVALGQEPGATAVAVVPPLGLHAGGVAAHVDVVGPFGVANGQRLRRPGVEDVYKRQLSERPMTSPSSRKRANSPSTSALSSTPLSSVAE